MYKCIKVETKVNFVSKFVEKLQDNLQEHTYTFRDWLIIEILSL